MQGAVILLVGICMGWLGCLYAPRRKAEEPKRADKYAKYKNEDGLYSRQAVRESKKG